MCVCVFYSVLRSSSFIRRISKAMRFISGLELCFDLRNNYIANLSGRSGNKNADI